MSHPRVARLVIPIVLILGWLAAAGIGGPYFGRVSEVSSNDQAQFLPASADATVVNDRLSDFLGKDTIPAVIVVTGTGELDAGTLGNVSALLDKVREHDFVAEASPAIKSEDGLAAQAFVGIKRDTDVGEAVTALRTTLESLPAGTTGHVTGPAGFTADLSEAFSGIDGLLLAVTLSAVLIILLLVYRALLLPLVVLTTSVFALCVALLTNWWLAKAGLVALTGQTQGILFILVIGAATDYSLLYTARYAEELRRHDSALTATKAAMKASLEPILASGSTVIAGLLCLLLSDLGSNRSLGPVASVGIVFAMGAAFTFLPAVLYLLGRAAYWPRRPRFTGEPHPTNRSLYASVGRFIAPRPRPIWIVCVVALALGAAFVPTLKADGVAASEFVLGHSDARDGQEVLSEHFPGGSGSPANVLTVEGDLSRAAKRLLANDGVDSVAVVADTPSGTAPVTADGIQPLGPPGSPVPTPVKSEGQVLLQATLKAPADSASAEQTIRDLRVELDGVALVGGVTAVAIDTRDTAIHDRNLIIPIVLAVILVILIVLLRSFVAPVLLIATTVLSFGTAMGTAALVFNHVLNLPGADASVPLYGFVFLVALGIDYNIFLMTRVREETLHSGTRAGILTGLAVTGGVITSAGIVLAATFAALAVIPILFLLQLAFIVAFGVLLDTFLVRTLLVPALGLDLGSRVWWPTRLDS